VQADIVYKYDTQHRLIRVEYDDGTIISYEYDSNGNRTRKVSTLLADTSIDGAISFPDFVVMASRWLDTNCTGPDWCDGADINRSGQVNLEDLAILAQQWLENIQ
jgi:YD repeat-containing protein